MNRLLRTECRGVRRVAPAARDWCGNQSVVFINGRQASAFKEQFL